MKLSFRIRERLLLYLSLLLMIIISGCKQKMAIDQSFTSDLPCKAPCWNGLELDVSSRADVLETVKQLSFVDKNSIHEYGTRWYADDHATEISYDCIDSRENCGSLLISEDRLKQIWIAINYPLTIKQAVDKLGQPQDIQYGVCQPGYCRLSLDWPSQNIFIESSLQNSDLCNEIRAGQTSLPPETQVRDIFYMVIEEGPRSDEGSCLQLLPWPGFRRE
jgi:hypothetical protein